LITREQSRGFGEMRDQRMKFSGVLFCTCGKGRAPDRAWKYVYLTRGDKASGTNEQAMANRPILIPSP